MLRRFSAEASLARTPGSRGGGAREPMAKMVPVNLVDPLIMKRCSLAKIASVRAPERNVGHTDTARGFS